MLMRTDPFRELDRLTQHLLGTPARPATMPIDAYRHGEEFVVEIDLPGVDPETVDLTVEQDVLTVRAQRQRQAVDEAELLVGERPHGSFSRQLFLGEGLDADRLDARYTDGVLVLRIPVSEKAKPRRVPIARGSASTAAIDSRAEETTSHEAGVLAAAS